MRRSSKKTVFILVTCIAIACTPLWWVGGEARQVASAEGSSSGMDQALLSTLTGTSKKGGYREYAALHNQANRPSEEIVIEADSFDRTQDMDVTVLDHFEGSTGRSVRTSDSGSIEWKFSVPQDGLYNIGLNYFTVKGKDSDIERELRIDGKIPFTEANSITFQRIWKDESTTFERDERDNDLLPSQIEVPMWQDMLLKDATGYVEEPYAFYFAKGEHTLTLTSVKEPLVIRSIKLTNPQTTPSYETIARTYKERGYKNAQQELKIQAEHATYKSSPTLLAYNDHSSPAVEPYHVSKLRNNAMGGWAWRLPGQWIEWEIDVPEDGLYQIALKNHQNYLRGMAALRTLYIDGQVPFEEVRHVPFPYNSEWQMTVLGKDAENPYEFYLTKGKHSIRFEVTLGDLAPILTAVESSILELNAIYREIISFTGTVPDTFRDYQLEQRIPDMVENFRKQSELLYRVAKTLTGPNGKNDDRTAMLNTLAYQLQDMADRPETVPSRVEQFKTNVGSLGAWLLSVNEQPLAIDYLMISTPKAELPDPTASTWLSLKSSTMAFFASFFENYDDFSEDKSDKAVTVWITSARDQAQTVKKLIDDTFTPKTGIPINIKLVSSDILLPSTVAGEGPDVALQVGNDLPVNYATRNAMQDLSVFPDFEQVKTRFNPSAMVPISYNGGVYALPETQTFPVLFYRKDILEDELHLKVPQTWDDVYEMLPVLQKHNLEFGLPQRGLNTFGNDTGTTDIITIGPNPALTMFLYQNDGELYRNNGMKSGLDSETAVQQFKKWTDFYVNYKIPIQADFANRFRTGEMPIGVIDYTMYNKLSVFAPEIKGLWAFAPVPGTKTADGTIRRETGSGGSATVMFKKTKNKEAAWEFMKWWTSKETQIAFGRQMEIRMGASARYPTANQEALSALPWPTKDFSILKEQMSWVQGVPEVPGGYLTGRNIENAFRRVVVQGDDAREALEYYVRYINEEITLKRQEFNLPTEK
ncbi:extracellular solute-binding protein [Paenibacillus guangzhouensis]|uniref:extracellular solute-binding protein n=1 Tax=Paenibacillus guangzhouensis TaxID=1473112 RepID=UPI0012668922|nr:extracellular solute-binding protein [Paenibacillus guangzhouensis]